MAKKHPTSRDRSRDRKISEDDKFVAGVLEASGWARQNQQTLVVGGIILLLVAAVSWVLLSSRSDRMDAALVELEEVTGMAQVGEPEQGKVALAQFVETYSGTPYAAEARLHLATLYLETDQPGQAVAVLSEAGIGPRDPLGAQFLTLQGKAYEAQGQWGQAADAYLRLADGADLTFQVRSAREDAARMMAEMGDYAAAAEQYAMLQEGLEPSDPLLGQYQMREHEMLARARG